jgi:hypothetical protein
LTSGKTDAAFLKQFGIGKLATCRKLATDHPDKTQVGLDESLPRQRSLAFEESQLLICRISETGARYSRFLREQPCFDRALELDNLGVRQQGFRTDIVESLGHAHTLRQSLPLTTPTHGKSVDNQPRCAPPAALRASGIARRRTEEK